MGKSLPPVRLQFNSSEHSPVLGGQKDWEQGRGTLTPVWGYQSQVGDMSPFDATPHPTLAGITTDWRLVLCSLFIWNRAVAQTVP